ncbi:metallophosphoesterase [Nocardioides sambongensis]|uniref:metallophosphoesterase n=1 Tax=Nocardioides sambongensis TaxID=2589074 RepID=UPI00112E6428|nr:metallophosphoesterase [Nocardioides sambongensis]
MRISTGAARALGTLGAAGVTAGLAAAGYGFAETRRFRLRSHDVPVLPTGMRPLRVLHLSDLHMTPHQLRKQDWVASLAGLRPDLVIDTGDNLAHRQAVPVVLDTLSELLEVPGVFVHGSNDYFEPGLRNPFGYLLPDNGKRHTHVPQLPWRDLSAALTAAGWRDLSNRRDTLTVGETRIAFAGVDDPHLEYDDLPAVAGPADTDADLRLAIAHAPYLRVLDQFAGDGYDAIIAGHTHGGQVCLPWGRALATNCDLEPARAKGLHRHPAASRPGDPGSSWLHVSAGLGTSPYAPVRIACKPEATLLTLLPA